MGTPRFFDAHEILTKFIYATKILTRPLKKQERIAIRDGCQYSIRSLMRLSVYELAIAVTGGVTFYTARRDAAMAVALRCRAEELNRVLKRVKGATSKGDNGGRTAQGLRKFDVAAGMMTLIPILVNANHSLASRLIEAATDVAFSTKDFDFQNSLRCKALSSAIPSLVRADKSLATPKLLNDLLAIATKGNEDEYLRRDALYCAFSISEANPAVKGSMLQVLHDKLLDDANENIRRYAQAYEKRLRPATSAVVRAIVFRR
jgi:hypothetical protein